MVPALAALIDSLFSARDAWESHFDACLTCGRPRICARGRRLHTAYATLKTRVERGS